jgi:hypothetical protein
MTSDRQGGGTGTGKRGGGYETQPYGDGNGGGCNERSGCEAVVEFREAQQAIFLAWRGSSWRRDCGCRDRWVQGELAASEIFGSRVG